MYPFIILCGGLATRLGPIAAEIPKCLLEVNNKPFLYYQLKYLEKSGAQDVYLSVGHLSEKFYDFTKNYKFTNISDGSGESDIKKVDLSELNFAIKTVTLSAAPATNFCVGEILTFDADAVILQEIMVTPKTLPKLLPKLVAFASSFNYSCKIVCADKGKGLAFLYKNDAVYAPGTVIISAPLIAKS